MHSLRGRKSPNVTNSHCSLKIIRPSTIKKNLSISIRLVKTPPAISSIHPSNPFSTSKSPPLIKPSPSIIKFRDPTDFIEPIPNTKDFLIQPANIQESQLCDTLPVPLKHYKSSPKLNIRVIVHKNSFKTSNLQVFPIKT